MSTINQIQLPNGSTYDFEDTVAREEASSKADKTLVTTSANGLMSAADKKAIDREFFRMVPKGGTYIPENADLNSIEYIKVGNYYNTFDRESKTIKNIPVIQSPCKAFMMYVLSPLLEVYDNESTDQWVYRLRIFITYTGDEIFVQKVDSGATAGRFHYGPWVKQTNSNDLGAVSKLINTHIAKKSNPHGVTKAQVGLGNVDNTADSAKSVKYATSAGSANSVAWGNVSGKPSTYPPSSHTHTKAQVDLGNVANLDQSKAIKSIARDGTTFTATSLDGTVSTFTQQDTNTTYDLATSSADGLMSAADKKAIDREFFRMLPKGGTEILNGADLNSTAYLKVGIYYQTGNVHTTNMTNIPFKAAFMMYVLSPLSEVYDNESTAQKVYRLRIFVEYTGNYIFTQTVYSYKTAGSFTYGPWVKMTNSNDLDAVSNTINTHIAKKSNPHKVTKDQVGLGSVANLDQSKAIKSITRNGTTFTATALDGTTTTFTQQDSSTTYSVATSSTDGLMSAADKTKLNGIDPSVITTNTANIKKNADKIATYIAGQRNPDLLGKGAYIGRKIEGGGTIFFDYAIGFGGGVYVAPITENLHSYHVDPLTGVVMCDDPKDTTKQDRFMVVSDYDIGDYKHGNNLTWSNGTSGSLYTAIGTATEFGTGKANTEKCIAAATTDGLIGWNTNAYNCIWHYVSGGDWRRTTDRGTHVWFVPSKDELTVLLYMQWSITSKRKSYDGKTQLIQLPINFYSNYWSSSEDGAMMVFQAYFCGGAMDTIDKSYAGGILVRLVRTF